VSQGFSVTPPPHLIEVLSAPSGRVLCLGHVHPDGDVLGTLFGLGLALGAAGAAVTFAGPHPIPGTLSFLPGADRWQVWKAAPGMFDIIVMTDCPNPERSEGLLEGARGPQTRVLNIDHHPDTGATHGRPIDPSRRDGGNDLRPSCASPG
jgi:phosphoesterase RecJ-like protein